MSYHFKIGNARPKCHKNDFPQLYAMWEVESAYHPDAPAFPNDEFPHQNSMRISYLGWKSFCSVTGLFEFFNEYIGELLAGHPGSLGITQEDVDCISQALHKWGNEESLPPGFNVYRDDCREQIYDPVLARLIWLKYWMQWAVKNCETPAIENS